MNLQLKYVCGMLCAMIAVHLGHAQNVTPIAQDDPYSVRLNSTLTSNTGNGVLANDTDANGNGSLSVQTAPVVGPANGSLTLNADGSFTYIPNVGYAGTDSYLSCM